MNELKFVLVESRKILDILEELNRAGFKWVLEESLIRMAVDNGISARPIPYLINAGLIKSYEPRATGRRYLSLEGDEELCAINKN